jgi:mRNA interferase MazF
VSEIRQGEIYWIDFGARAGSAPADRYPCVVVQSDVFNRSRIASTVICLVTSNLKRAEAPGNVALKKGEANLTAESVVNVSQILTVDKQDLIERIGRLLPARIDAIRNGLQLLFERV